ncbi:MAG: hypothetical protein JXM73_14310 [Anaerolineae bacterium]|nr:hypothetical protein [Anaerolineae bacterium]
MALYTIPTPYPTTIPDFFRNMLASREGTDRLITVCAACYQVRDDHGCWQPLGEAVLAQVNCRLSHSICPTCMHKLYPEYVN